MQYCHVRHIVHRDIKPKHLLIAVSGHPEIVVIKIAGFGRAKLIESEPLFSYRKVVTLWYRAPELLLGTTTYSYEIDVWSVGCIFAEMTTTKRLFQAARKRQIGQLFKIFQ